MGLPQWSHPAWPGHLLGVGAKPAEHLAHYARVFNTVEGNTTFYASPTPDTVQRWADAVPAHFRFSFKFPQTISHQSDLVSADKQVSDFIRLLEPLHDKLGLLKLQLPARFGPQGLPRLAAFSSGCHRRFAMPSRCATPISSPRARRAAVEPAADGEGHQPHHARQPYCSRCRPPRQP